MTPEEMIEKLTPIKASLLKEIGEIDKELEPHKTPDGFIPDGAGEIIEAKLERSMALQDCEDWISTAINRLGEIK